MHGHRCGKCEGLLQSEFDDTKQPYLRCLNCGGRTYVRLVSATQPIQSLVKAPPLERLRFDAWHKGGVLVEDPWGFPSRKSKRGEGWEQHDFFEKDRGNRQFKGGGTVKVQVFLDGAWHWMSYTTDGDAFRKLANLPHRSRALLLESLALVPIHAELLSSPHDPKRPRGANHRDAGFWHNADYWTPHLRAWAESCHKNDPLFQDALTTIHNGQLDAKGPGTIAASLYVLAWKALHQVNEDRFPMPQGKNLVKQVAARIRERRKSQLPEEHSNASTPSKHHARTPSVRTKEKPLSHGASGRLLRLPLPHTNLVTAILNNDTRNFPVLSPPEEFGPSVRMTDFRFF